MNITMADQPEIKDYSDYVTKQVNMNYVFETLYSEEEGSCTKDVLTNNSIKMMDTILFE